jgi:hypothetical protein
VSNETNSDATKPSVDLEAGKIEKPKSPFSDIIVPIGALLLSVFAIWGAGSWFRPDSNSYVLVLLAYPLVFGAAGVLLGGSIGVQGNLSLFGIPLNTKAVGGIGAAMVGFAFAFLARPHYDTPPWTPDIAIKDIPILEPDVRNKPPYFVTATVEGDSGGANQQAADFRLLPDSVGSGRLSFKLFDKETIVRLRSYSQDAKVQKTYVYQGSCVIRFYRATNDPEAKSGKMLHKTKQEPQTTLAFREGYVRTLIEANINSTADKIENICLEGEFDNGDGNFHPTPVVSPQLLALGKGSDGSLHLFFLSSAEVVVADKTAQKEIAQGSLPAKEVLGSSGETACANANCTPHSGRDVHGRSDIAGRSHRVSGWRRSRQDPAHGNLRSLAGRQVSLGACLEQ